MKELIILIKNLRKTPVKQIIDNRMSEFENVPRNFNDLFRELVFCILTAGTSAKLGIKTIDYLGNTIFTGSEKDIQKKLKEVYRFHTLRAGFIHKARNDFRKLDINDAEIRMKLVENIKGIGYKEASHFLRNIGHKNISIIDFHIVDFLVKNKLIDPLKSKSLTPKKYLEIENVLRELANKTNTNLGELDLYLWYAETGKILK